MKINIKIILIITSAIFLFWSVCILPSDFQKILSLKGEWKFSIGDDIEWAAPDFDDSDWDIIMVPSSWEEQGYHGYNGYAWYRLQFHIPSNLKSKTIYLNLGYIDDVDETYINGYLVGSTGSFSPNYETAYNAFRKYPVPVSLLNIGSENTIAVRVYDSQLSGGIVSGDIGLYRILEPLKLEIDLSGTWRFNTGDSSDWKYGEYDSREWKNITVPGYWEPQGFRGYNGVAWYRKTFHVPEHLSFQKLVVVLGKIDDIDEAFLNGVQIGSTGKIEANPFDSQFNNEWLQFRGYYIPRGLIKPGKNVLAVRVFDGYKDGGIYEGPVGIVTQKNYVNYWKSRKKKKSIWEIIFD